MSSNPVVDIRSCNSYLIGLHTKFGPINMRVTMKSGRPMIISRNIMVITHPTELLFNYWHSHGQLIIERKAV